jgi:hypothetical protein
MMLHLFRILNSIQIPSMNPEEQTVDPAVATFAAQQLKRSRLTAVVLAAATIVSLLFLVFAFIQKSRADLLATELAETRQMLEACRNSK